MNHPQGDAIELAWSAEIFQQASTIWANLLSDHLEHVTAGEGPVLNWADPHEAISAAEGFLQDSFADSAESALARLQMLMQEMLSRGQNLHHPRYIGHQVPASSPLGGLFDAVGSVTNQVMAIYEMGPWSTAIEHALIRQLCQKLGWSGESGTGLLTHGGSLANLTALLTARNVRFPEAWKQGLPAGAVLVANADVHYCVTRTAGILGLGVDNVIKVPVDDRRRMRTDLLSQVLTDLQDQGRPVIAVSACAGATPTGAFDDLQEIATICARHQVWMHVDAAHGGALAFSQQHRRLLQGIELADSVVWDAHKMLFVPALCTAVLYRNPDVRFQTFAQDAPYLFDPSSPGMADIDSGMRTVECTKRAAGFGLWGLWSVFGEQLFEQLVDRVLQRTREFYQLLLEADDFEPRNDPSCNILTFRYCPSGTNDGSQQLNTLQRQIRSRIIQSGQFYLVQTSLDGEVVLRTTVMNPLTTVADFRCLLDVVRQTGQQIASESSEVPADRVSPAGFQPEVLWRSDPESQ